MWRGLVREEWEEGERNGREEGSESSGTIGGEKEKRRPKQRVHESRERGREGCLLVIRQGESQGQQERVHISWDRIA